MKKQKNYDNEIVVLGDSSNPEQSHNAEPKISAVATPSKHTVRKNGSMFVKVLLILCIVYVLYLILGILTTEFYTDRDGKKKAVKGDIETLEDREDYDNLTDYISQVRDIIRDITIIDIKTANEETSYGQAAVQYEAILNDQVDLIIPRLKTVNVQTRNEHIKQDIQVILSNDIAFYLQLMVKGLKAQDMTSVNEAVKWKESMMQTYGSIDKNIRELAEKLHREESDFFNWELEKAVTNKDKTAILKSNDDSSTNDFSSEISLDSSNSENDSSVVF